MAPKQKSGALKSPKMDKGLRRRLKAEALVAMGEHHRIYGPTNWNLVREREEFNELIGSKSGDNGERTFRRWVANIKKPCGADTTRPHESRAVSDGQAEWATQQAATHADHPVLDRVTPAYLMRTGAAGIEKINLAACIPVLMTDAARLRAHALQEDPSGIGGLGVKDPKILSESMRRTMELMQSALNLQRQIDQMQDDQQWHNGLITAIVEELQDQPEVLDRVLARIEQLNSHVGVNSPTGGQQ